VFDQCASCHVNLGQYEAGDGAAVFLIFVLGFLLIPLAWFFEIWIEPPLWVHVVLWGFVGLSLVILIMPRVKAYIILLEYRHRL
jgi:uncharacterized protein (DUF983 family)